MNKEFLEIVGIGKPTGSVLKDTIAVSVTISTSVQNRHSRILLRILSCSRVKEKCVENPKSQRRVPVEECFNCPARITSKELAPIHSVKMASSRMLVLQVGEMDADLVKSALIRIARLKDSLAKGLKRMETKVRWLC